MWSIRVDDEKQFYILFNYQTEPKIMLNIINRVNNIIIQYNNIELSPVHFIIVVHILNKHIHYKHEIN